MSADANVGIIHVTVWSQWGFSGGSTPPVRSSLKVSLILLEKTLINVSIPVLVFSWPLHHPEQETHKMKQSCACGFINIQRYLLHVSLELLRKYICVLSIGLCCDKYICICKGGALSLYNISTTKYKTDQPLTVLLLALCLNYVINGLQDSLGLQLLLWINHGNVSTLLCHVECAMACDSLHCIVIVMTLVRISGSDNVCMDGLIDK